MNKRFKRTRHEFQHCDDFQFLAPTEISAYVDGLWEFFLSSRLFNGSFEILYQKCRSLGWKEFLNDQGKRMKIDQKFQWKRLMLNRLMAESTQFTHRCDEELERIRTTILRLMSETCPESLERIEDVYAQVQSWRILQIERRLFVKQRGSLCSLFTLQRLMTDHFLILLRSSTVSAETLREFFGHCFIIIDQPSGPECLAVTKYEKLGKQFHAKLHTRLLCLLDPDRIGSLVELSNIKLILVPYDRRIDPYGDIQGELLWQRRILTSSEGNSRTFLYAQMFDNETIQLKKFNSKDRLLYNNELCQLRFVIDIRLTHLLFHHCETIDSQPFGICCRANYFPKYLIKVFILELSKLVSNKLLPDENINYLEEYFVRFFRRFCGVKIRSDTIKFIRKKFCDVYDGFNEMANDRNAPVMFFSFDIYEDLLTTLFNQMKYFHLYPFLSLMYQDGLFLGIADPTIDTDLRGDGNQPKMFIRFETFDDNPNLLLVIHNGQLRRSRLTSKNFVNDLCRCICDAAKSENNPMLVFTPDRTIPYRHFAWYYDESLNQSDSMSIDDEKNLYPLKLLLNDTMRRSECSTSSRQDSGLLSSVEETSHSFLIVGRMTGHHSMIEDVFQTVQSQFYHWCEKEKVHGAFNLVSLPESTPSSTSTFFEIDQDFD